MSESDSGTRALTASALDFEALYGQVLADAKEAGFVGFGGACFNAAIALNNGLFGGKARLVAALNAELWKADYAIGHAAVKAHGAFWDADGYPKVEEDILSWGMLDENDSEIANLFYVCYREFSPETCAETTSVEFETENAFRSAFNCDRKTLRDLTHILTQVISGYDLRVFLKEPALSDALAPCEGKLTGTRWRRNNQDRWIEIIRLNAAFDEVEVFNVTDMVTTGRFSSMQPRRLTVPLSRMIGPKAEYSLFDAPPYQHRALADGPTAKV